jgi:hypothetical protein
VATTTQFAVPARTVNPLALWHLLSLDAPTVAALWAWFVARTCEIRLPLATLTAMYLAVWMLYAADRLLDARLLDVRRGARIGDELEARHIFHHRHRRAFLTGIAIAGAALAALLPHLEPTALLLYLIEGALLFAWFLVLHATNSAHRLPKEIAVGLFFSAAIFIPTVAREPGVRLALLPSAILFGALCCLNCLFIYAWEHEDSSASDRARPSHSTTRLAVAHLTALAVTLAVAGVGLMLFGTFAPQLAGDAALPAACAVSALLLLALDRKLCNLSRLNLRAAADLALLTPLLLLPILR